jgi:hypothetical protein
MTGIYDDNDDNDNDDDVLEEGCKKIKTQILGSITSFPRIVIFF